MLRLDMALTANGTAIGRPLAALSDLRANKSRGVDGHLLVPDHPQRHTRLWVTDHTLEPQTIAAFLQFLTEGRLPGGEMTDLERPTIQEVTLATQPFSAWAPAPYDRMNCSTMKMVMMECSRPGPGAISKDLQAMKSRIWTGIVPLSERRWNHLNLDDLNNFHRACLYISSVNTVFYYLNHKPVKAHLRRTFNQCSFHFKQYENALNSKRRLESTDGDFQEVSITKLWYEYIKAHYAFICDRAHSWAIEHIDRLRQPILEDQASYPANPSGMLDDAQWWLADSIHDLAENVTHADSLIFIPTDGYTGDPQLAQDNIPLTEKDRRAFREEAITWSANTAIRRSDYAQRVRYLSRQEHYREEYVTRGRTFLSDVRHLNDPTGITTIAVAQIVAQDMARKEIRGEVKPSGPSLWFDQLRPHIQAKGFIAYRLCQNSKAGDWDLYKTIFKSDIDDWGREFTQLDQVREDCEVLWLDGKELGIADGDVEAARK